MPDRKQQFIDALRPFAEQIEKATGIPAPWTLAMAANETGWDASNPVLFGIKGASPSGKSGSFKAWEVYDGKRQDITDQFATYSDPSEAFQHLAQEMQSARYRNAPRTSARDFAAYLQKQGWATDPQYANKIARLANEIGDQQGGGPVPQPENDQTEVPREKSVSVWDAEIAKLQKEETELEAAYQNAQTELSTADYTKVDAINARLKAISGQLVINQRRLQQSITERERIRNLVDKTLDNTYKYMQAAISAGKLSLDQAEQQWQQALDLSKQGVDALYKQFSLLSQASPQFGTPEMGRAVTAALRGWQNYGATPIPDFSFPITPFDPGAAMQEYMPPKPQWGQAQQALSGAQGQQPNLSPYLAFGRQALLPEPAAAPAAPMPVQQGAWRGPLTPPQDPLGQAILTPEQIGALVSPGGQSAPPAAPAPPTIPWQEEYRPSPQPLTSERTREPWTTGVPAGTATPIPSGALPLRGKYYTPEDILEDESLAPGDQQRLLAEMSMLGGQ